MNTPRLLIAGTHSGVGKSTVATGLMAALATAGHRVQPFKVGPDYIDPGYHTRATGRISRNLDAFMLPEDTVREVYLRAAAGVDIAVIEGVMGLYDGLAGDTGITASTAHVAKIIKAPVILVLDVRSTGQSAAAMVLGYRQMDREVQLAGVILNQVSGSSHYRLVKDAVEQYTGVPVLGCLMRGAAPSLPERHLGLVPTEENAASAETLRVLAQSIGSTIDMDRLWAIARSAPEVTPPRNPVYAAQAEGERVPVAIARDQAFGFAYQDSLDLLAQYGAELLPFSPLGDRALPPACAGLILPGGFPEIFAGELAANRSMRESILVAIRRGLPVYAECGGLMYLSQEIRDFQDTAFPMVGVIPAYTQMRKRLAGIGYRHAALLADSVLAAKGTMLRGHEFHYSTLEGLPDDFPRAYRLTRSGMEYLEGYNRDNILASYMHLHLAGHPEVARYFLAGCRRFRQQAAYSGRQAPMPAQS